MTDRDVFRWSGDGVVWKTPDWVIRRGAGPFVCLEISRDRFSNLIGHRSIEQTRSTLEPMMKILWKVDLRPNRHVHPPAYDVYTAYIDCRPLATARHAARRRTGMVW